MACPTSTDGAPLEEFLFDPPVARVQVDEELMPVMEAFGLQPRGVQLVELGGVYHVLDWVGSNNYPNAADFLEECRRFGPSRLLSPELEFEKLEPDSRMIFVHAHGYLENHTPYYEQEPGMELGQRGCPKDQPEHYVREDTSTWMPDHMCARLHWQTVERGDVQEPEETAQGSAAMKAALRRLVHRRVGDTEYAGYAPPDGLETRYQPAMIASFPIHHLDVIRSEDDPARHEQALAKAWRSTLDVRLEDE